ncbi:MAG TPA: hypothetical protein VEX68_27345 [Bryobacteraceae bacterium]|nr:hypothetical protein [Bryobacteraceae bacterium]
MTLSSADAAQHAIENPFLHPYLGEHRILITSVLLALLAIVFLKGFKEAIGLATLVSVPYILLNVIVLGRCLMEVMQHPTLLGNWESALQLRGGDWTGIMLASALIFPRLALGLSGFETGVSVMPLIKGDDQLTETDAVPHGRIKNTRKLLAAAAIIMSCLLLVSSFVTTLLIPKAPIKKVERQVAAQSPILRISSLGLSSARCTTCRPSSFCGLQGLRRWLVFYT